MRKHLIGIVGFALVLLGLVGILLLALCVEPARVERVARFRSNGQQIYLTGVSRSGPIPRAGSMMVASGGCVGCHGSTGRGGHVPVMMGGVIEVPDIRYSTLALAHKEDGEEIPAWTEAQIERAIREGVEPNGKTMNPYMPRWDMGNADMTDLIGYLKELK